MKVSIAMCSYNGGRYIEAQLESIAAQERAPDELVVCDDCSGDDTVHLIEGFARRAAFPVRVIANHENLGTSKNFEQAIGLCAGDIILLADQDDIWMPQKLKRIEAAFNCHQETGLVLTNAEVVDERLEPLGYDIWQFAGLAADERRCIEDGRGFRIMLRRSVTFGITMAFHARYKKMILPLPANQAVFNSPLPIHDKWIALIIASVARVGLIEEKLLLYRQHVHQQTGAAQMIRLTQQGASAWQPLVRNVFESAAATYREMRATIAAQPHHLLHSDDLKELDALIAHLEARARVPLHRLKRVPHIVRELGGGGYHRYANGWRSAIKDLM